MSRILGGIFLMGVTSFNLSAQNINEKIKAISITQFPELPPFPAIPTRLPADSVTMGDWKSFPEMKLDIPVADGPFKPTWQSIEKNYPGEPAWLREAKFGITLTLACNRMDTSEKKG